jgi:peptide/nickel transport system substrate-binding protein
MSFRRTADAALGDRRRQDFPRPRRASSRAVDLLVGALHKVGVELNPQVADQPTFNQRVISGDTEMSLIVAGGMNSDIAPDYLRLAYASDTKSTQHAQGYRNPEVDRLAAEQLRTLDEAKRKDICAELQRIIASDVPLLPLFYPGFATVVRLERFQPWYHTPGGVAGTVPTVENKQIFVTGNKTGLDIRATS